MRLSYFLSLVMFFWLIPSLQAEILFSKNIAIQQPYLIFPISEKAEWVRAEIRVDGKRVHHFDVGLAPTVEEVDWWAFLEVEEYRGKELQLRLVSLPEGSNALTLIRNVAEVPRKEPLYQESLRPQLRFSQKQGWNNDPNGMVFHNGVYHFFWQSNPVGKKWGNMYWGHAVSRDLVHWEERPLALRPFGEELPLSHRNPSMAKGKCFSGSANIAWDRPETEMAKKELLAAFTDTGCGEAIAVSMDGGETWRYESYNPVISHRGRDPKLIWWEAEKCWIIAVYEEKPERVIAFYKSSDRKNWTRTGDIAGFYECPEMFPLPVDGDAENVRWVLFGADAQYMVGQFDGQTFLPEQEGKHRLHYGRFYAAQCFSNVPGGRVIQVGWAQVRMGEGNTMPFNMGFSLPLELSLKETPEGIRLFANPIAEWEVLREDSRTVAAGETLDLEKTGLGDGQLYDIEVQIAAENEAPVTLRFGENTVVYDPQTQQLEEMPLAVKSGETVCFRVIVDRPMYEICGQNGAVYKTEARKDGGKSLKSISLQGNAVMTVYALKSIW